MSLYAPQIQSKGLFGFLNQCSEILCSCEDLVLLKYFSLFITNILAWVCQGPGIRDAFLVHEKELSVCSLGKTKSILRESNESSSPDSLCALPRALPAEPLVFYGFSASIQNEESEYFVIPL